MKELFLDNYSISRTQFALFPLLTPFAARHWQKKAILHRAIACAEFVPVIGAIISIVEYVAFRAIRLIGKAYQSITKRIAFSTTRKLLFKEAMITNKALFKLFDKEFTKWKKKCGITTFSPQVAADPKQTECIQNLQAVSQQISIIRQKIEQKEPYADWVELYESLQTNYDATIRPTVTMFASKQHSLKQDTAVYQSSTQRDRDLVPETLRVGNLVQNFWSKYSRLIKQQALIKEVKTDFNQLGVDVIQAKYAETLKRAQKQLKQEHAAKVTKIQKDAAEKETKTQQRLAKSAKQGRKIAQAYQQKLQKLKDQTQAAYEEIERKHVPAYERIRDDVLMHCKQQGEGYDE